jgi:hypothetical protein
MGISLEDRSKKAEVGIFFEGSAKSTIVWRDGAMARSLSSVGFRSADEEWQVEAGIRRWLYILFMGVLMSKSFVGRSFWYTIQRTARDLIAAHS